MADVSKTFIVQTFDEHQRVDGAHVDVIDGNLHILGADRKTVAIFRKWDHVTTAQDAPVTSVPSSTSEFGAALQEGLARLVAVEW